MTPSRIAVLAALALLVGLVVTSDAGQFLSLEQLRQQQAVLDHWRAAHPWLAAAGYFAAYVAVTALSLPGAALMTLAGGALFGLLWGTVLVSFASSLGATAAFLVSRFLLREAVQGRFGERLRAINAGIEREGAFYLFTLRLVPAFPFFAINVLMGLTPMKTRTFYWVSQAGMLAGTAVYVNAGTQLAKLESVEGIFSPGLLASFAALGVFPLLARRIVEAVRARRVYAGWRKPARFDRNLVVIGAGSAGLVSAYIAAALRARVTLIEKHRMGGDCLYTGCVPSKALIRSARLLSHIRRSQEFGIRSASAEFNFADVMERVQRVIRAIEPHDSVERYSALGVECMQGEARIVSPWEVEVSTAAGMRRLSSRSIVVAAGARPFIPAIPGIEDTGYLTSETLWGLRSLPRRLLVLGGGPVGCELAQCFARLGSQVTQVEMQPRLMMREDPEVSELVAQRFRQEGVDVRAGHRALRFEREGDDKVMVAEHDGHEVRMGFDLLLCAVGRVANTTGYGLEALGIPVSANRTVEVNPFMATKYPNIYACGDVAGPWQFTHTASHTAWYAAVNALFGTWHRFRADFSVIPWATFTEPEVARVGLNETEAKERGIAHEVTVYGMDELDRAIADGEAHGFVKVLTVPGKDRILGATIVGEHAGDLITEFVTAMKNGIGLNRILGTIHVYPTLAEANKFVAGNWKRAHAPAGALKWLERYHAWMRG
jgi:pyruvate/2-oxoglutarate dehydrogenase complex dihydrolipoamide dehydrogenase (E3) component/uncharacterized membrane protein YdjX (TVP38/TMEM64 family)